MHFFCPIIKKLLLKFIPSFSWSSLCSFMINNIISHVNMLCVFYKNMHSFVCTRAKIQKKFLYIFIYKCLCKEQSHKPRYVLKNPVDSV